MRDERGHEVVVVGDREAETQRGGAAAAVARRCAVVGRQLAELRELVLGYDAAADRGGAAWDGLRIEIDLAIGKVAAAVRSIPETESRDSVANCGACGHRKEDHRSGGCGAGNPHRCQCPLRFEVCAFCGALATCWEAYGRSRRFCCDTHRPLEWEPLGKLDRDMTELLDAIAG